MNCQSFENSLTDLARQHPLEATALADAQAHAGSCSSCALRLEEQNVLTAGFRSLVEQMRTIETPSHLESRLMEAFREGRRPPQRTQAPGRAWFAVAAVAAVLLVVFGVVALRLMWAPAPAPIARETVIETPVKNTAAPEVVPEVRPVSVARENPVRERRYSSRRTARHRVNQNRDPALEITQPSSATTAALEVTSEFMQLGDGSVGNLQEGAQVVRVEMPRYAMARFGLPVNMERYDERVKADIWLGADGLARAIRFVQ
ncbi:MAG TPA: hypothetical protein VEW46_22555 [Pyrinomonadaceae bacterium]|nr:hypothetical protein [Pyrinomonadaceae bacterium]